MQKSKEQMTAMAFQKTFSTEDGKHVLGYLSKKYKEFGTPYVQGSFDGTAFMLGERSVILHVRKQLEVNVNQEKQKEAING